MNRSSSDGRPARDGQEPGKAGAGRRGTLASLVSSTDGQSLIEFSVLAPLLLLIFLGMVEAATAYDRQHMLAGMSREAANIASRGADLEEVVDVVTANGASIGFSELGGVVVSRILIEEDVRSVTEQVGTPGYVPRSRVGAVGEPAVGFEALSLLEGQELHVVELFYDYNAFTPVGAFIEGAVPNGLYSQAVF